MSERESFEARAAQKLRLPVEIISSARNGDGYLHAFDSMSVMQPLNGWWEWWQASREALKADPVDAGWIACSERMPDEGAEVYIFCDGEWVLEAQYREGDFYDVVRDGSEIFETVSRCVSHWQLRPQRPAAPGREG